MDAIRVGSVRPTNGELSTDEALRLIEAHGVGTWSWDLDNAQVHWSAGVSAILGITHHPAAQTLEAYEELVHPDDRPDFRNPVRLATSGILTEREFRIIRPSGEQRWVRSFATLIYSRDGRPERLVGATFDVTTTRLGLYALQQKDGLFTAIRDLFDVVIWTTDRDGEIRDEVDWWRSTGQAGRVDKWRRLDAVHPDDRQRIRDAWEEALRSRKRYAAASRVKWGESYVPIISRASPVMGADGDIEAWVGFTARQDSSALEQAFATDEAAPLTPGQVRAARGFLGWSAEQLAAEAGVSFSTVRRVETPGERGVRDQSIAAVRKALERAGITFTAGTDGRAGVSLK